MPNFLAQLGGLTASAAPQAPSRSKTRDDSYRDAIQASAKVDTIGERKSQTTGENPNRRGAPTQEWQQQVWKYYDEIGELHYATNFVGACLSRCRLTVGIADDDGVVGPVFDSNGDVLKDEDGNERPELALAPEALALVKALQSDTGGQSQMLRLMGVNLAGPGEFHLVGSQDGTDQVSDQGEAQPPELGSVQWEVLSTDEFRPQGSDYERVLGLNSKPLPIPGAGVHVIRVWRPHPRFSLMADSSIRPVLDVLEELYLLTRQVRAETLSRVANTKILLVPDEIESETDEVDDEGDEGDSFTRDLIETMTTAISDKGSAAAVVPFVLRAPGDQFHPDRFRVIDLAPTTNSDSAAKRNEAVLRFAQGVDLPVEIVTGHANTTFANAVVIDDSLFKSHIEPVLEIIADALTVGYLRPGLPGDTELKVYYDSTELVARPNRGQDAKDLHDRFVISDASLRDSTGFSDSDKASDEEIAERIAVKQQLQVRTTAPASQSPDESSDLQTIEGDNGQELPVTGETTTAPAADGQQNNSPFANDAISFATEVSIERGLRRAGARLRSRAITNQEFRSLLASVPDEDVARVLGPTNVRRWYSQEADLLVGEFDALVKLVKQKTGDQAVADKVRELCIEHTCKKLYAPTIEYANA